MSVDPENTPDPKTSSLRKRVRAVAIGNRTERMQQWIDLVAAVLMAVATIATAWSAYQSSLWGGNQTDHSVKVVKAFVRVGEFNNLAMQRIAIHVSLIGQYTTAISANNRAQAAFLLARFPEPLKTATMEWSALDPLKNPAAPASPFDMPSYVLRERMEADRWEQIAGEESDASSRAGEIADRYLIFTIVFAAVLFFAGISGKFNWHVMDILVLVLGALALLAGMALMFTLPMG